MLREKGVQQNRKLFASGFNIQMGYPFSHFLAQKTFGNYFWV